MAGSIYKEPMQIAVLGINYKSSTLSLRELFARACENMLGVDNAMGFPFVLLSTCNRTEIYFSAHDLPAVHSELLQLLRTEIPEPFEHLLYSYFGIECFFHLAIVASGLDSVVIAESEIQRQVKTAYETAQLHRALPHSIHFSFQKALKIGKGVRSSYPTLRTAWTLPKMIFQLAIDAVKDLHNASILFIGNSEINRSVIASFRAKHTKMTLCTRSVYSAEEFAARSRIRLIDWSGLENWPQYDLVICGTRSHDFLLTLENLSTHHRTQLLIDLGMPRNIDPRFKSHAGISLFNIDELGEFIDERKETSILQMHAAESWVRQAAERQAAIFCNRACYVSH
jgi:glutamyl-tRNA reductase